MNPPKPMSLLNQLRQNAVALISLFIAVAGLGYNTWRNETAEAHRNIRQASFKTLEVLGELQVVVDARQYQDDRVRGDYVAGWARVTLIGDLGSLVPAPVPQATAHLREVWQVNFEPWYSDADPAAEQRISAAIAAARQAVLQTLATLR
jgi:hypothetical protein